MLSEACCVVVKWDTPLCTQACEDVFVLQLFVTEVLGLVVTLPI